MSDWQVGDKVVRVKGEGLCSCKTTGQRLAPVGEVCTIVAILPHCFCEAGPSVKIAGYENRAPHIGWCRENFRKIRPDEQEACEPEFVTLLKRIKVSA